MRWVVSHRADYAGRVIADRHYNRQHVGAKGFVPPGRCLVLVTTDETALWVTSYPFAEYVKHQWAGAWVNSTFRNEGEHLSSELIREAVAATRCVWEPPALGMVTFVDASKVRRKRDPGRCYLRAGFPAGGRDEGRAASVPDAARGYARSRASHPATGSAQPFIGGATG